MLQFPIGVQRVVHHGDTADFQNGVIADDTGDDVGKKDRNAVSLLDAQTGQARGKPVNHLCQFPIGHPVALEQQCHVVGEIPGRAVQELRDTRFFIINRFRDSLVIMGQPRFALIFCRIRHEHSFL